MFLYFLLFYCLITTYENMSVMLDLARYILLRNFMLKLYSDIGNINMPNRKIRISWTPPNSPIKSKKVKIDLSCSTTTVPNEKTYLYIEF